MDMSILHVGFFDPLTISAVVAGVGAATSLFGASKTNKANKKLAKLNKQLVGVQNEAADLEQAGNDARFEASQKITGIQAQQENLRQSLINTEARRNFRQSIRQEQLARATAVARASGGGGLFSTGLTGVLGNIQNQGLDQRNQILNNLRASNYNFSLNRAITDVQTGVNQELSDLGGQIADKNKEIRDISARIGNTSANADFGKSLFGTGINLIQNSATTGNVFASTGTSLFG